MKFHYLLLLVPWALIQCANERAVITGTVTEASEAETRPVIAGALIKVQIEGDDRFTEAVSGVDGTYEIDLIIDERIRELYPPTGDDNSDLRKIVFWIFAEKAGYESYGQQSEVQIRFEKKEDIVLIPQK